MATIRQKGPEQWHAQVRRTGWPPITETKRTRDLTVFLYQRMGDYCIGMISSRW
jgi:hypothetical protein